MKLGNISRKEKEYLTAKINEHGTNSKINNIRDLCKDIDYFKEDFRLRTNSVKFRRVICLQSPTVFG